MELNPAVLDTLAFAGIDETEMRKRGLASRPECDFFEHELSFVRRRIIKSDDKKPTLAIIPDGPATIESYDAFIDALKDRFTIIILELPGFGFSFPKSPAALRFEDSAQILCEALADCVEDNAILVGPCVQGLVAARMAEINPKVCSGLIICQTGDFAAEQKWSGGALDPKGLLKSPFVGQIGFRLHREESTIDWWSAFAAGPKLDIERFQTEARKMQQSGCCYALASQVQAWMDNDNDREMAPPVPTAIIWGLADKSHVNTDRRSIFRYAPDASYQEIDDLGHFPDLEDPELIAQTALALIG